MKNTYCYEITKTIPHQIQSVQNETHVCLGANNTKPNRRKIPIFITTLDWNWQKTLARASNIEDSPGFGL